MGHLSNSLNYELVFRPITKQSSAVGLLCLPLEESNEDVQDVTTAFNLKQMEVLPMDAEQLSKET